MVESLVHGTSKAFIAHYLGGGGGLLNCQKSVVFIKTHRHIFKILSFEELGCHLKDLTYFI